MPKVVLDLEELRFEVSVEFIVPPGSRLVKVDYKLLVLSLNGLSFYIDRKNESKSKHLQHDFLIYFNICG